MNEQLRIVNLVTDTTHGVMPDGFTTLCGIDTRNGEYEQDEYGEFGDMSCGKCRRVLEGGFAPLLEDLP